MAEVRNRKIVVDAGTGAAISLTAVISLVGVGMFMDWLWELPWGVRFLWFIVEWAAVGYLVHRHIVVPLQLAPDLDGAALLVEKQFDKFKSRLISTLQLTRPGALAAGEAAFMVKALIRDTEKRSEGVNFLSVVRTHELKERTAWLLGIVGLAGLLYGLGDVASAALLKRAFLSANTPVPRKTQVTWTTGDFTVGRGDPVVLQATATGVIPKEGRVALDFESGRDSEFTMEKSLDSPTYTRTLESVQESFYYTVYLNDGRSKVGRVNVVPRPTVAKIEPRQVFPRYTRFGIVKRSLADLTLLSGSRLNLVITANKVVTNGYVQLHGVTNRLGLLVNKSNPVELLGAIDIPAANLTGFSIHLTDEYGLTSRDEAIYRVDVLPDRTPQVRITFPERREELITSKARMLVAFEAIDDFAVSQVLLRYQIDGGETNRTELVLADGDNRVVRRRYDWEIAKLAQSVSEGSSIEYWIEVADNNNITGPGTATSEHFLARIVSEEEKRADLMNRVGDSLGSIGEAAKDQETLNDKLGNLIKSRAEQSEAPGVKN